MKVNLTIDTEHLTLEQKTIIEALSTTGLQEYIENLINQNETNNLILGLLLDIREQVYKAPTFNISTQNFNNNFVPTFNNTEHNFNNNSENSIKEEENNSKVEIVKLKYNETNLNENTSDLLKKILKMKGGKH